MAKPLDIIKAPWGFLFSSSKKEQVVAEHVIREHHAGRDLKDILKDAYVTNRLNETQIGRLLERSDISHAVSQDVSAEPHTESL